MLQYYGYSRRTDCTCRYATERACPDRRTKMIALPIVLCLSAQFCSALHVITRSDRIWPIGRSTSVDLPQSSPFGPRLKISEGRRYADLSPCIQDYRTALRVFFLTQCRYDFHRGVDIPIPLYSNVYAIADGTVRIAGSHPLYSDGVVQVNRLPYVLHFTIDS